MPLQLPPLGLYVHIPWCIRKCPYCDFNSHAAGDSLPEDAYIEALLRDFDSEIDRIQGRPISSIFFGGGTPSLFAARSFDTLFDGLLQRCTFSDDIEITLEANPGTFEQQRFTDFRKTGINRLSVGVQSFDDRKLNVLGRIHNSGQAHQAIHHARCSGFDNINIDLMHGLPSQTIEEALRDLEHAIALSPNHLSWYQLTIEPNTEFHSRPPTLPADDTLWQIQQQGQQLLASHGFDQYEISAYSQPGQRSRHNLNYWRFGDFLGIGAGAHGKWTNSISGEIFRNWKTRMPSDYLARENTFEAGQRLLKAEELPLEFMMNALRLTNGVETGLFAQRTGLSIDTITSQLKNARDDGLLEVNQRIRPTTQGRLFLNNLLEQFLP